MTTTVYLRKPKPQEIASRLASEHGLTIISSTGTGDDCFIVINETLTPEQIEIARTLVKQYGLIISEVI